MSSKLPSLFVASQHTRDPLRLQQYRCRFSFSVYFVLCVTRFNRGDVNAGLVVNITMLDYLWNLTHLQLTSGQSTVGASTLLFDADS